MFDKLFLSLRDGEVNYRVDYDEDADGDDEVREGYPSGRDVSGVVDKQVNYDEGKKTANEVSQRLLHTSLDENA